MQNNQSTQRSNWSLWVSRVVIGLGLVAIAGLMQAFIATLDAHVLKAKEISRDVQWKAHAPIENKQAAMHQ